MGAACVFLVHGRQLPVACSLASASCSRCSSAPLLPRRASFAVQLPRSCGLKPGRRVDGTLTVHVSMRRTSLSRRVRPERLLDPSAAAAQRAAERSRRCSRRGCRSPAAAVPLTFVLGRRSKSCPTSRRCARFGSARVKPGSAWAQTGVRLGSDHSQATNRATHRRALPATTRGTRRSSISYEDSGAAAAGDSRLVARRVRRFPGSTAGIAWRWSSGSSPPAIHHILIGPDHIAVPRRGCCRSAARSARLALVVTAFTLAHKRRRSTIAALRLLQPAVGCRRSR
mgnify:CR=1 FL=1